MVILRITQLPMQMLTKMADKFLSDEDKALFRKHMHEVKPLNPTEREKSQKPPKIETRSSLTQSIDKKTKSTEIPFLSDFIQETVSSETILSYCRGGVSHQRFAALKKGQIPWEARIDLHGMTSEQARESLCRFIETQIQNHKKCLLIIHGKGGYRGMPPVVKNLVHRWLPQFEEVLAYHSTTPKDGGTGALYVLLKKNPLL